MNVGGDGNDTYPTISPSDRTHYDTSKLDQWEVLFAHAARLGIFLHVQLSEAEQANALYHDNGELGHERKLFYRELIARFGHHPGIEWDLGEENRYGTIRRESFAAFIAALDPYRHPITTHTRYDELSEYYAPLLGNGHFTMTAFQAGFTDLVPRIRDWRQRSADAGVPWVISLDEPHPIENDITDLSRGYPAARRNFLWPVYLAGGGGFEWYVKHDGGGDSFDFTVENLRPLQPALEWTGHALRFLSELPILRMEPRREFSSADLTLADAGNVYALYDRSGSDLRIDLSGTTASFRLRWFDPENGVFHEAGQINGGGVRDLGRPPFDGDAAAILSRDESSLCGTDAECDDGNVCNGIETCVPALGCVTNAPLECDDGIFCNGLESCDPHGGCTPAPPPLCDDGIDCTADRCDPGLQDCTHEPTDAACDDGKICNGNETCAREVGCTAGVPPDCRDRIGCTADFCLDSLGGCVNMPINMVCSDRNACNGVEVCHPESGCSTPQPDRCDDGNACTSDSCSPTGGCVNTPLTDGANCDGDRDVCNGGAVCTAGQCRAVPPPDCDDGRVCNGEERCDPRAGCIAGALPVCDDGVPCTADACVESAGGCRNVPVDAICEDGDICDGIERCDSRQGCVSTPPLVCADGLHCNGEEQCHPAIGCIPGRRPDCRDRVGCTADGCVESAGGCVHIAVDSVCDDRNACNGKEFCSVEAGCSAGAPPDCGDGDPCNGEELCEPALGCVSGSAIDCTPLGDDCNRGTCDVHTGACRQTPIDNIACDDGDACTLDDRCKAGVCEGRLRDCNDGLECTLDACEPESGLCFHDTTALAGEPCGGGRICNVSGACELDSGCIGDRFIDVIDFDDLPAGIVVDRIDGRAGSGPVGIHADNDRLHPRNAAILFDSSCAGGCSGGDDDLGTPHFDFGGPGIGEGGASTSAYPNANPLGNLLIVAQNLRDDDNDGLVDEPNDQGDTTATIELDFSAIAPVGIDEIVMADVEDKHGAPVVELFGIDGELLEQVVIPAGGNNSVVRLTINSAEIVSRVAISLAGSGALDRVRFATPGCAAASAGAVK